MKKLSLSLLLALCILLPFAAHALPRDADAVLNRCGKPLGGDETVYENSVAGGHRTLKYERGVLRFDRVANEGWTFVSGTHKKEAGLNAEQMEKYMPCLKDALTDSAQPAPLKPITPVTRIETSAKRAYKTVLLCLLGLVVLAGGLLFLLSKRKRDEDDE